MKAVMMVVRLVALMVELKAVTMVGWMVVQMAA